MNNIIHDLQIINNKLENIIENNDVRGYIEDDLQKLEESIELLKKNIE